MYDSFSVDYDRFVNWKNRLAVELPFLEKVLREAGARRVLDAATGTGMHAIALAKAGFDVLGADFSAGMVEQAHHNAAQAGVQVPFEQAGFGGLVHQFGRENFDAVLCLGNSLPHVSGREGLTAALDDFAACLKPGGLLLVQNRNFDAVMEKKARWMEPQAAREGDREWIFVRFYDFEPDGMISFHILTLQRQGAGVWQQTLRTTALFPLLREQLSAAMEKSGFGRLQFFGDMTGAPFDAQGSGNLVVSARRGK